MQKDRTQQTPLEREFDRQVQTLVSKEYPQLLGLAGEEFVQMVSPLKSHLGKVVGELDVESGKIPFVVVVKTDRVPAEKAMLRVQKDGKAGVVKLDPHASGDFGVIEDVVMPKGQVYLILDIDRGKESINLTPRDAMKLIRSLNRSPLTIDEGVALITHFPEFLIKNNCFSLLASRHSGDKRVPAIWINGQKQPNLGWCWEGNPHTWLGSASCVARVG